MFFVLSVPVGGDNWAATMKSRAREQSSVLQLRSDLGLTHSDFGRLVGASERAIRNWEAGEEPRQAHARLLVQVQRIYEIASKVMKRPYIGTWLTTPADGLDGLKPLEALERGEHDRVWRLLFAVESGGYR